MENIPDLIVQLPETVNFIKQNRKLKPSALYTELPSKRENNDLVPRMNLRGKKLDDFYIHFTTKYDNNKEEQRSIHVRIPGITKENVQEIVKDIILDQIKPYEEIYQEPEEDYDYGNRNPVFKEDIEFENTVKEPLINRFTYNYGNIPIKVEKNCMIEAFKMLTPDPVKKILKSGYTKPLDKGFTIEEIKQIAELTNWNVKMENRVEKQIMYHKGSTKNKFLHLVVVADHIEYKKEKCDINIHYITEKTFNNNLNELVYKKRSLPGLILSKGDVSGYSWDSIDYKIDKFYELRSSFNTPNDRSVLSHVIQLFKNNMNCNFSSTPNEQVGEIIRKKKMFPIIKNYIPEPDNYIEYDFNRMYMNLLINEDYVVPIFNIDSEVEVWNGIIVDGAWYRCTHKGNSNYYTDNEVRYFSLTPTHQILPSDIVKSSVIKKAFKSTFIVDNKKLINSMIGCFWRNDSHNSRSLMCISQEDAVNNMIYDELKPYESPEKNYSSINKQKTIVGDIYVVTNNFYNPNHENYRTLIATKMGLSRIKIDMIYKYIVANNGPVYSIKVDALSTNIELPGIFELFNVKMTRKQKVLSHKELSNYDILENNNNIPPSIPLKYTIYKIEDMERLIIDKKSFTISGKAGYGKSYNLKLACKIIERLNRKYKIGAYTHNASRIHTNGETIHYGLKVDYDNNMNIKVDFEYYILDEFSMTPLELMFIIKKLSNLGVCIIMVGDHTQFSPILSESYNDRYFCNTGKIKNGPMYREYPNILNMRYMMEISTNLIILDKNYRTETDLIINKVDNYKGDYDAILVMSKERVEIVNAIKLAEFTKNSIKTPKIVRDHVRYRMVKPIKENRKIVSYEYCSIDKKLNLTIIIKKEDIINEKISEAITWYSCQGQEYDNYLVENWDKADVTQRYVLSSRRTGSIMNII